MTTHKVFHLGLSFLILTATTLVAQGRSDLAARIDAIMSRPEFKHSHFGVMFYSLDRGQPVYELNAEKLFTPGSTTKLISAGSALRLLGQDYRFRTPVYRTGPVASGVLDGDLVLVASGDPNLSGRIRPDGTLAFENQDHNFGGPPVSGDPLLPIRALARQVAARGIREVRGTVLVDASLFPEGQRELGSGTHLSPVAINDNLVDLVVGPGPAEGTPITLTRNPVTSYVRFVNHATTGLTGSRNTVGFSDDVELEDGTRIVTVRGRIPLGDEPGPMPYRVPTPSRYAEIVFLETLHEAGVSVEERWATGEPDFDALSAFYRSDHLVAEHVSPPLREAVKVNLKVSQNLHASMIPFHLAPILSPDDPERTGFDEIHDFLTTAELDLSGAQMGDGAGGDAHFSPAFMVSYLRYMARQDDFEYFRRALPVLGVDGTLWDIQPASPAAGHIYAKTGTFVTGDPLNRAWLLTGKGLAGYVDRADGTRLAFAIYINNVPLESTEQITPLVGQAIGEIAAAAYDAPLK